MVASIALIGSLIVANPAVAAPGAAIDATSAVGGGSLVDAGMVRAAAVVGFNPENIISDALFYDGNAMSSAEIQTFLDAKIGACRNDKCLNVLTTGISSRDAVYSQSTGNLICSAIQGGSMKVSELIYRVQVACGISAKVILVTLQKEQGLTTSKEPSDWNLKAAMGASCPDTAPCDPAFAGVGPQILKGTQQLKTYKAAKFAKQPGRNYVGYSPTESCGGTYLNIQNHATAALYSYTPYQPNAAALAAGYGLGDGCSSYGNRNFYNYYTAWFGSAQYPQTDTPFVDVSSDANSTWFSVFSSDIVWMFNSGISQGWRLAPGYQEYRPTQSVTRDVMAAFLYRLAGSPSFSPPSVSPFADVSPADVFYKEIAWLTINSPSLSSDERFRPSEPVTREDMAGFLYDLAGQPPHAAAAQSPFIDVAVSSPSYRSISWLAAAGISSGWDEAAGRAFRPAAPVTRDVMAAFLRRMYNYLNPFTDVASMTSLATYSVFANDIAWLASAGITQGWEVGDRTRVYRPFESVTRDVMAAFLYRLAGSPDFSAPSISPFADVQVGQVFYKEISWLAAEGISEGWQEGATRVFRPAQPVSRDVMAAFLYRMAGSPESSPSGSPAFVDVAVDGSFYREIAWMASSGISSGWSVSETRSEYRPFQTVSRDVMAAFLHRFKQILEE